MFKFILLCNIFVLLFSFSGFVSGTPLKPRAVSATASQAAQAPAITGDVQSLVALDPSKPLNPLLVDLLDQYNNLQKQANTLPQGNSNRQRVISVAAAAKSRLQNNIVGVASLSDGPASTPPPYVPSPTTRVANSTPKPVVTTIAQAGFSTVVVVSDGKTSTIAFNGGTATRSGSTSAQTGRVFSGSTSGGTTCGRFGVFSWTTISLVVLVCLLL